MMREEIKELEHANMTKEKEELDDEHCDRRDTNDREYGYDRDRRRMYEEETAGKRRRRDEESAR